MIFFKNIFKKKKNQSNRHFFGSTEYERQNFICGIGESEILDDEIKVSKYPFEPSSVYPEKTIRSNEISAISWDSYPPLIRIDNEVIFITRENSEELKKFAARNRIKTFEVMRNWEWLLEPYLDTEHTDEKDKRLRGLLEKNGFENEEIIKIRNEVKNQMLKYNFDTMLWEWGGFGFSDVLSAMRVKYDKSEFADFYYRGMEIQLRTKQHTQNNC